MTIPIWAWILGGCMLYVFVGIGWTVTKAFLDGRAGRYPDDDGVLALIETFFWPLFGLVLSGHFIIERYGSFIGWVQRRGEISVMPPENEHPGRRVDVSE